MKTIHILAAVATLVAAPAFADQLAANAGLSPAEAQGMSLSEVAQAKFNRDSRGDDRHVIVTPGTGGDVSQLAATAGLATDEAAGMTLDEIFVAKINREGRGDDQQMAPAGGVTMSSRSMAGGAAYAQLAASAGVAPDAAAGMTLGEIAAAKFARDTDPTR